MEGSLTPEQAAACLDTLGADRLRALLDTIGLEATDRRSRSALMAAISRAPLPDVVRALRVPELRAFCTTLGVYDKGTKDVLVKRVLAAPGTQVVPSHSDRPDGAAGAGALKAALRRFTLEAAAGFGGRDAQTKFVKAFFTCFGWRDGEPPGAEIPASLSAVELGRRMTRPVAAVWGERRVLVDVVAPDVALDPAWNDLLRVCLEQSPGPQFVVLTNQRELRLYDLARDRSVPRLATPIDDLPKYSDAFVFLGEGWVPGTTPKIVNVGKVSREVADLVAKLYRSLKSKFPKREAEIIRFTLQCIITMFAEDIGLLPPDYFTTLLYEGARHRDVERRLGELFTLMGTRDVKPPRPVAYFNGGIFAAPVTLPLGDAELTALTRAAEAHWKYVDPHIFGSVFQGIMDDAERHASGAHYTAHEDIMRVVGPTIVEPWRKRIAEAKTLAELLDARRALAKFRVLDPACGSGNFLYVAFRELYSLETQLLARIREFPSGQGIGWGSVISTLNFHGIDTNAFAVELAKVTLNIAKKIAFEDRRQKAADVSFQGELEVDPSLPLDNLDKNIVCADALFTAWPEVDAIVSNPPFLGGTKIRADLGDNYLKVLLEAFPEVPGRTDLCAYWFRRAHEHLPRGARAGLVGTSGIRVGKAREASLDYIVANGGTITNAVSSRVWPGEAAVNVSMVNWVRGPSEGPHQLVVEDEVFSVNRIPTHLQLHADVSGAQNIAANAAGMAEGVSFGHAAFRSCGAEGFRLGSVRGKSFIRPVATGDDLLRGRMPIAPDYCIDLRGARTEAEAKALGGAAFEHLRKYVYPTVKARADSGRETDHYKSWLGYWWKPHWGRDEFFATIKGWSRMLVCPKVSSRPSFAFISTRFVATDTMKLFAFDDDYSFGIMQSSLHWAWTKAKGSKVRTDIQYTTAVWRTFPWPQAPSAEAVTAVAEEARNLRRVRDTLMKDNGSSLRALHQAAEIDGPHPLKEAQRALDEAVSEAYGMPSDQEVTEFLLDLNCCLVEDEAQGRTVTGPGLPPGLDPKDPRWLSDDCIEPPPISE
ncbi:DNA methyltransferase [Sorangium sp. So ce291]|uniref:DNA methyltransferase n=1 Tax=Sorangium sp. So ce291 TaxID=3133294 RepID=UPI003F608C07